MTTYNLNVRAEYLSMILDGRKTIEVRVAYPRFAEMAAGDTVRFNGEHAQDTGTDVPSAAECPPSRQPLFPRYGHDLCPPA